jgi:S1-C subfamily serine protease
VNPYDEQRPDERSDDEQRPDQTAPEPAAPEPTSARDSESERPAWWSRPAAGETQADERVTWTAPIGEPGYLPAGDPFAQEPLFGPSGAGADADALDPVANRRRFPLRRGTAATVAAVVLSAAAAGTVVHVVDDHSSSRGTAVAASTTNAPVVSGDLSASVKSALAKISPSVVIINDTVTSASNGRGGFGGFGGFQESGAGTGIIITADGEIVTNAHVVNGATDIKVTLPNNGGTHSATVVGIDTSKDLAVIKVSGVSGLTPATFANSDQVQVGDSVIAVGNALGYGGSPTVTEGIISAKGRSLQDTEDNLTGLLQTDAAINPGNSGGPLVDANGDVVGINVAVATGSSTEPAQNIGFTIPSNTVVADLPSLKAGQGSSGSSGSGQTQNATYLGVEVTDTGTGAGIVAVAPNSPASKAGLQAGDVVTKFNSTDITSGSDLQQAVRSAKSGDIAKLTVVRGGSTITVTVTLGTTQISS